MKADTARTCCAFSFVAAIATLILLFASGAPGPIPHIACSILAVMSLFIGATQNV